MLRLNSNNLFKTMAEVWGDGSVVERLLLPSLRKRVRVPRPLVMEGEH